MIGNFSSFLNRGRIYMSIIYLTHDVIVNPRNEATQKRRVVLDDNPRVRISTSGVWDQPGKPKHNLYDPVCNFAFGVLSDLTNFGLALSNVLDCLGYQ